MILKLTSASNRRTILAQQCLGIERRSGSELVSANAICTYTSSISPRQGGCLGLNTFAVAATAAEIFLAAPTHYAEGRRRVFEPKLSISCSSV